MADTLDVHANGALYRVFVCKDSLQIDLSFWRSETFRPTGEPMHMIFGEPTPPDEPRQHDAVHVIRMGWLYPLHARSAVARRRTWQAEMMLADLRNQIIALACIRLGLNPEHGLPWPSDRRHDGSRDPGYPEGVVDMIGVRLAYGRDGLDVALPAERTVVVEPRYVPGATEQAGEVRRAVRAPVAGLPLRERLIAKGAGKQTTVAISVCDGTRAQPRRAMLPVILAEIADIVDLANVVVLIATGTHRGNSDGELLEMLGPEVMDAVTVVNHDARDSSSLVWCGDIGDGVPVWLNRLWVEADVKITTGFVEPHFFAGFSGGPKMIAPGLAGLETVLVLHDAKRIGSPNATWAITNGNPVHDDVRAIAAATGCDFAVDVVMNRDHQIVQAFAGDLLAMHAEACRRARGLSMVGVPQRFDVVVTTNSGYPLDQNLYQSVKGMSAGATVLRPGGRLIVAAECSDGYPDHGSYVEVLTGAASPEELLDQIAARSETVADQWQVQIQARTCTTARVGVHCEGLTDEQLAAAHLDPVADIADDVATALEVAGRGARCCVLPEGPQTIAYVTS